MGSAEKRIADWLIENPGEIISLSIVDLAEKCKCGEATIVRFAKRLGFSGYQELKISLAQENNSTSVSTNITPDDTIEETYDKVCNEIYCSLEKTKMVLDNNVLAQACEKIVNAIYFYIVYHKSDNVLQSIQNTERSLLAKKY